jgi:hypothetical protein
MRSISNKSIGSILIAISIVGIVVGLLVLIDIIPTKYVWGSRISSRTGLIIMELVTVAVNSTIIWLIGMRISLLRQRVSPSVIKNAMLILAIMMGTNTLGNLAAKTNQEKLFAILTAVSCVGFLTLYRRKE